jgi:hypothetical protein
MGSTKDTQANFGRAKSLSPAGWVGRVRVNRRRPKIADPPASVSLRGVQFGLYGTDTATLDAARSTGKWIRPETKGKAKGKGLIEASGQYCSCGQTTQAAAARETDRRGSVHVRVSSLFLLQSFTPHGSTPSHTVSEQQRAVECVNLYFYN